MERWVIFALLSAVCAAAVAIIGKAGLKGVDPDAATVIRSLAMAVLLTVFATALSLWGKVGAVVRDAGWKPLALIALSGAAGAASWVFYFRALKEAPASRVAPIDKLSVPIAVVVAVLVLGERPSAANWVGVALMVVGAYLVALPGK